MNIRPMNIGSGVGGREWFGFVMSGKFLKKLFLLNWIYLILLMATADAGQSWDNIQNIAKSASHNLSTRDTRKGREMLDFTSRLPDGQLKHLPQIPEIRRNPTSSEFRIGVILPLSGEHQEIGQQFLDAIFMALFDLNNADIMLLPVDSQGTAVGALHAAREVYARGAEIFVGPIFDHSIKAVSTLAKTHQIPIIGFSSNRNVADEGIFLLNFLPEQQVEKIVAFAVDNGVERFAALIPDTVYGRVVEEAYIHNVNKYGGEVTNIETYVPDFDNIGSAVKHFVATTEINENDAIFVPEGGMLLVSLVSHLAVHDIDTNLVHLLGTGLWDDENLKKEPSMIDGFYAAPSKRNSDHFSTTFKKDFGKSPHRIVSLAYDSLMLASTLKLSRYSYADMQKNLSRAEGYVGVNGLFRLWPGGLCERGLTIYKISKNGPKEVVKAPSSFQPLPTVD